MLENYIKILQKFRPSFCLKKNTVNRLIVNEMLICVDISNDITDFL